MIGAAGTLVRHFTSTMAFSLRLRTWLRSSKACRTVCESSARRCIMLDERTMVGPFARLWAFLREDMRHKLDADDHRSGDAADVF